MYGGDYSRKKNLVDYGFRLPAAMDNRPLTFDEFESLTPFGDLRECDTGRLLNWKRAKGSWWTK